MTHALNEFLGKPPCDRIAVPFDDQSGRAVFAGRWALSHFDSLASFRAFTERYDSVMQGCLQGMPDIELADWFVPPQGIDTAAPATDPQGLLEIDAVDRLNRDLSFAEIPWLNRGDHTRVIEQSSGDTFGGFVAKGSAGFLVVFVSDLL